jgi:hypothetical protein
MFMFRFAHSIGLTTTSQNEIEIKLDAHRMSGSQSFPFSNIDELCRVSGPLLDVQFDVLSSMSNYHWGQYPVFGSNRLSSEDNQVGFEHHYAYQVVGEGRNKPKVCPQSIRNRFIYCTMNNMHADRQRLLMFITDGEREVSYPQRSAASDDCDEPFTKVRRLARRPLAATLDIVNNQLSKVEAANMTTHNQTLFEHFSAKLIEIGTLKWRIHSSSSNTFSMNDYSSDGDLLPTHFVHTTREESGGSVMYSCTCSTYSLIQSLIHYQSSADEDEQLPGDAVCMHCQFIKYHIDQYIQHILNNTVSDSSPLITRLHDSRQFLNLGVVPLTVSDVVSKFSVLPRTLQQCAMVHVSRGIVSCQSGACQILLRSKRPTKVVLDIDTAAEVCPHLEAMRAQKETWHNDIETEDIDDDDDCALNEDPSDYDSRNSDTSAVSSVFILYFINVLLNFDTILWAE